MGTEGNVTNCISRAGRTRLCSSLKAPWVYQNSSLSCCCSSEISVCEGCPCQNKSWIYNYTIDVFQLSIHKCARASFIQDNSLLKSGQYCLQNFLLCAHLNAKLDGTFSIESWHGASVFYALYCPLTFDICQYSSSCIALPKFSLSSWFFALTGQDLLYFIWKNWFLHTDVGVHIADRTYFLFAVWVL